MQGKGVFWLIFGVFGAGLAHGCGSECAPDNDKDGWGIGINCKFFDRDCDDNDPAIHPRADEVCDNKDNNCDGETDENLTQKCSSACGNGLETCVSGVWKNCYIPHPPAEMCDGKDNNCDGKVDEGCESVLVCWDKIFLGSGWDEAYSIWQANWQANDGKYIVADNADNDSISCNPYNIAPLEDASSKCKGFEELDYWALFRGLNPLYVRAIAWAGSGLDTADPDKSICAVSYPVSFTNGGCNDGDYQVIPDPSGHCTEIISLTGDYTGATAADYKTAPWVKDLIAEGKSDEELSKIPVKPCGLGLLQNIEYPYTKAEEFGTWGSAHAIDPTMCAPDGKYNPYNASHSACLGTFRISSSWDFAEKQVNEDPAVYGIYDDDPEKTVKIKYVIGFMVYYRYAGAWNDAWIDSFVNQAESSEDACKDDGFSSSGEGTCCGNNNFIDYVTNCKDADGKKKNGMHVLQKYVALKTECGEEYGCPPAVTAKNVEYYGFPIPY